MAAEVVLEATNRLDSSAYQAAIVIKPETIEYWRTPAAPAGAKPQRALITLKAIATQRKSWFARNNAPFLLVCYGLGRLEFDTFCALVREILSACDIRALPAAAGATIDEICERHGVMVDKGEFRRSASSAPVPFLMLFDRDSIGRGY